MREDRTWESWDERLGRCFQCLALDFAVLSGVLLGLTGKNMTPAKSQPHYVDPFKTLGPAGSSDSVYLVCAFATRRVRMEYTATEGKVFLFRFSNGVAFVLCSAWRLGWAVSCQGWLSACVDRPAGRTPAFRYGVKDNTDTIKAKYEKLGLKEA